MQNRIHLLDTLTANQIAAGEVVERPLSVVKELVENAIDAAARHIEVKIFDVECSKIQVSDDGVGMSPEDMLLSVKRHATSKIRRLDDLENLFTLGFRGEALPSIAAVSYLTVISKQAEAPHGYSVRVEEGKAGIPQEIGARNGAIMLVERLFYNAPARKKFLKSPRWELGLISDCLQKLALSHPQIAFKLVQGNKVLFASEGGDLASAVRAVYGPELLASLVALDYVGQGVVISGFCSLPELTRADRSHYSFFVNSRWVKSRELSAMVDEAYHTLLPQRRYPLVVLSLGLPQHSIDVNVHPAKLEVKFQQPGEVKEAVLSAIRQALLHKEALAPQLYGPRPTKPAALPVDPKTGFIKLEQSRGLRLRESPGLALDGKTLAERLYGGRTAQPGALKSAPPPTEQRLNFHTPIERADYPLSQALYEHLTAPPEGEPCSAYRENSQAFPRGGGAAAERAAPRPLIYAELRVLGQAEGTYIVATGEDGVYFIDQHAAQERVLYERIAAQAERSGGESRMLALPQTMQLTVREHILLTEEILNLNELGFILEHFGENTYIIRGTPLWYEGQDAEGLLRSMLTGLAEKSGAGSCRREEIFMAACKQAVKANRYLTPADISALFSALDNCANSSTCPHGRPIAIKITFAEIRKRFYR